MPRIARGHLEQGFFHVLNRGNHRQTLFHAPGEYGEFLELLTLSLSKFKVNLWGYCLMGNHWHMVVGVGQMSHLSRWMHWLGNKHVRTVHRRTSSLGGGHIYQGRYKSFPIQDEVYLYQVLLYVEANPLRARLVARAQDWPWSSLSQAPVYNGLVEIQRPRLAPWDRGEPWRSEVNQPLPPADLDTMRQSVVRGTPFGRSQWIDNLAKTAGMNSTVQPRGRPRKVTAEK
jgi:putative transposase